MRFGAITNSARGGPQRPPPMGDRVKGGWPHPIFFNSFICPLVWNVQLIVGDQTRKPWFKSEARTHIPYCPKTHYKWKINSSSVPFLGTLN